TTASVIVFDPSQSLPKRIAFVWPCAFETLRTLNNSVTNSAASRRRVMTLNSWLGWFTVASMPAKCMRLAIALMAVHLSWPRDSAGQIPDWVAIHRGAVDIYVQTGDLLRAVTPLQQFKTQDFERALEAVIATKDPRLIRAAAVFHLDIAAAVAGMSPGTSKVHIDLGRDLLEKAAGLRKAGLRVDSLDELRSTWLAVAGSVFLSIRDPQHAIPYIREALGVAPKSARVLTVLGTAEEVDASGWNADDWTTLSQRERNVRERIVRLG